MEALSDLSRDDDFFNELMNNSELWLKNNTSGITMELDGDKENKKPRKTRNSKSEVAAGVKPKEKSNSKKKTDEKPSRQSKKPTREPLKIVITNEKTEKKNDTQRKSTPAVANPSPNLLKGSKQKRLSTPKIVIYSDSPSEIIVKENEKKKVHRVSKSWDGARTTRSRKSVENSPKKSPSLSNSPRTRKTRSSDISAIKSPAKGRKNLGTPSPLKNPTKGRTTRSSKIKDFQMEEEYAKLEAIFPNVDPTYLRSLKGPLMEIIDQIILKEKIGELPTRAEYVRKLENEKHQNEFLETFSVENFLKIIPDPWDYFLRTARLNCSRYEGHSLFYLKKKFKNHFSQTIQEALLKNDSSLYLANKELKKKSRSVKMRTTSRTKHECDIGKPTTFDPQFIYEVAFIENESKIKRHMKKEETTKYKKFKEAQERGTFLKCQSCYYPSLLWDDAVNCPANHVFCKNCVVKNVEVEMEKGNFHFKCPLQCEEVLSLDILQKAVSPLVMSNILKRLEEEEIKSAGLEDLVCCPFCNYFAIMPPENSVFQCQNPRCMLESCRFCGILNHVPLKCKELQNFETTILEDNAKESSVKCSRCQMELHKETDSSGNVCSCGATICSHCLRDFPECPHIKIEPSDEDYNEVSSSDSDFVEAVGNEDGKDLDGTLESKYFDPSGNFSDLSTLDSLSF